MATDSNWSLLPSAKKSKRCNNLQLATGEVTRPTQRDLRCGATGGKVCSGPNWSLTSAQRLNGSHLAAGELARLAQRGGDCLTSILFIRLSAGLPSLRSWAGCNFVARSDAVN